MEGRQRRVDRGHARTRDLHRRRAKLPPMLATTILLPKYSLPPSTSALILLAIEPNTTSAQIPIVMPEIVSTVRSLRRHRFRRSFIVPPKGWL